MTAAPLRHSQIRAASQHAPAGRTRMSTRHDVPLVSGAPTHSPAAVHHQDDEAAAAEPASDRDGPMRTFDLTQAAYALETLLPDLREEDVRRQRFSNLLSLAEPGTDLALGTAVDACRQHVMLRNLVALGDFLAVAAPYEDEFCVLLSALQRGDDVRLICTPRVSLSALRTA